jgi:hypothetical protein
MTVEERLRSELTVLAGEAPVVDVWSGVQREVRVRRRRRTALGAVAAVVLALVAASLGRAVVPRTQPAQRPAHIVDLGTAPTATLPSAVLVVALPSGPTYAVTWDGQAVRLPVVDSHTGSDDPALSADGTTLSGVAPELGVVVTQLSGGHRTDLRSPLLDDLSAVADPRGSDVIEMSSATGGLPVVRQLDLANGRTSWSLTVPLYQDFRLRGSWSADGNHLALLYLGPDRRIIGVNRLSRSQVERHRGSTWGDMHQASIDAVSLVGWAPSMDGTQVMVGSRTTLSTNRDWYVLDAASGRTVRTLSRPFNDRLLAWTSSDRLVWWRTLSNVDEADVVSTALDGSDERTLFRIAVPHGLSAYAAYAAGIG